MGKRCVYVSACVFVALGVWIGGGGGRMCICVGVGLGWRLCKCLGSREKRGKEKQSSGG